MNMEASPHLLLSFLGLVKADARTNAVCLAGNIVGTASAFSRLGRRRPLALDDGWGRSSAPRSLSKHSTSKCSEHTRLPWPGTKPNLDIFVNVYHVCKRSLSDGKRKKLNPLLSRVSFVQSGTQHRTIVTKGPHEVRCSEFDGFPTTISHVQMFPNIFVRVEVPQYNVM